MNEFAKKYSPESFEKDIYQKWEKQWKFLPKESITWNTFYIPMPPPNVTSKLHVGHSVMLAIQDLMTRYHRMIWDSTLMIPWTDHAWISTQVKVEEKLAKEGKSKHTMTREEFLKECWDWNNMYGWIIQSQFRKMWTSCDWTKEKFTFEPSMNKQVVKAFVDLYKRGLIYKWEYMVNYDPVLNTVVSDQEVIYKEEKGKLYYITYFVSWSDSEVVVATTRPETMLGDVAVAVNPKDKRYKKILKLWKKLILPILNKEIPLIADDMVDIEFWTWAVKITPAHDPNDFQVALRHKLPMDEIVLGKDGKMTEKAGIFSGQDFITARQNIVELLKSKGNLLKIEEHTARVGYGERSHAKIETIVSKQWFVKVQPLADKLIAGYKRKDFEILPERYNKVFEDWIFNLRDWCISRQLIWGHQIPVWYSEDGKIFCAETEDEAMEMAKKECGKEITLTQDPDALDTWFSSALWPFAILWYDINWKKQTELFEKYYPAQVLETGHDIIFFWVVRMLLFWYEFTWKTPFKTIYLHGLVRDKHGRKMSKSAGNGVDPIDMIEKHWTDALRLTLTIGNTPWNDIKFDEENVENNKIFINKLWNACRFVSTNIWEELKSLSSDMEALEKNLIDNYEKLMIHEKWILSRIRNLSDIVGKSMEEYSFSLAGQELQVFTKNEFCDYYIEEFKLTKENSKFWNEVITYVISHLLRLWHPYIPFVTEELYQKIGFSGMLIEAPWSKVAIKRNEQIEEEKEVMMDLLREIRSIKAENDVPNSGTIKLYIYAKGKNLEMIEKTKDIISGIVKSEYTEIITNKKEDENLVYGVIKAGIEFYIDISNAVDREKERERLELQIIDMREYIAILDKKLLNESFVRRAPQSLVREEMEKKRLAQEKLKKLEEKLDSIC